jgi:dienelactone hydrolase
MRISTNRFTLRAAPIARLSVMLLCLSSALFAQSAANNDPVRRPVITETAVPVETIKPGASDGHAGLAFLRKPPGNGPFPAVILVHGGAPAWDEKTLRDFAVHIHASRFLEAGYVVIAMTRRDLDLSLPVDAEQAPVRDALAVFDYVSKLPYVDPNSIVVRGTSVGGYLTLELEAARDTAAILVEEPFSFPFVGIKVGQEKQTPLTNKIQLLNSPILLTQGDQTPNINDFNRDVFIPAVQKAGKTLAILTYPGGLHSFAFYDNQERTPDPALSLKSFNDMAAFFRKHLVTQPVALSPALVTHEAIVP